MLCSGFKRTKPAVEMIIAANRESGASSFASRESLIFGVSLKRLIFERSRY
jgi:hypothetical protein